MIPRLQILVDLIGDSEERMDDLEWLMDNGRDESEKEAEMWHSVRPSRAEAAVRAVAVIDEYYAKQPPPPPPTPEQEARIKAQIDTVLQEARDRANR